MNIYISCMRLLMSLILSFIFISASHADEAWQPGKTHAVIAGVLEWQGGGLASFSKSGRKDAELARVLTDRGVPQANVRLLLDGAATKKGITASLREAFRKAGPGDTLIFYYAGHGVRKGASLFFANADIDSSTDELTRSTGLSLDALAELFARECRAGTVILMADCCYSGGLTVIRDRLTRKGSAAIVLASASASNISTGSWTFSQTMIDALRGDPLADRDGDGKIILSEIGREVTDAMKYRERQRSCVAYDGAAANTIFSKSSGPPGASSGKFRTGAYVLAKKEGRFAPARIVGAAGGGYRCAFYSYNTRTVQTVGTPEIKELRFKTYAKGKEVTVSWGGAVYPARILKVEDDFHWVSYTGWSDDWNEWVMEDRISEGGSAVQVEYQGTWYPAVILEEKNGRYKVRYLGYDSSWDEWVDNSRLKK